MSNLTESHLLSIFGFGKDDIFVGGAEGTMLHFDGKKWDPMDINGRWNRYNKNITIPQFVHTV